MKKKIAVYYDNLYSQEGYTFGGEKGGPTNIVVNALKYINSGKVLDIGAGEGRNALFLAKHGFEECSVHPFGGSLFIPPEFSNPTLSMPVLLSGIRF